MNAQKLAYRIAMTSLIEPEMEPLEPRRELPEPPSVIYLDPHLLADDPSELDMLQEAEEQHFIAEVQLAKQRGGAHHLLRGEW